MEMRFNIYVLQTVTMASQSRNLSTPLPGAIIYEFDLNIANITSNGGTAMFFQVGNNYNWRCQILVRIQLVDYIR